MVFALKVVRAKSTNINIDAIYVNMQLQSYIDDILHKLGIPKQRAFDPLHKYTKLHQSFRLPIQCLDPTLIHVISENVSADLELLSNNKNKGIYECLFQPTNEFGRAMIREWSQQITSDTLYLVETQDIILKLETMENPVKCERVMEIWNTVKSPRETFMEHYCYMDIHMLSALNRSPGFLQLLFVSQMMSPLISFIVPFLLLLLPFVVLKIRGVPLDFSTYCCVLQDMAKNHFIGRMMSNMTNISVDKIFYMIATIGVYIMQIFQNISTCKRFYKNVQEINRDLIDLRDYLDTTITSMENFLHHHDSKPRHRTFIHELRFHLMMLIEIRLQLRDITPFSYTVDKSCSIGTLMKCYYEIHADPVYDTALRYTFGWNGYIDNLHGVKKQSLAMATFTTKKNKDECSIEEQVYPPLAMECDSVSNTCNLTKNNIILTGPNASGKTTLLKTTALNIIFTQQVGCGFYKSCTLVPYTHIHSYLNIPDTQSRDSLFQAEARRCKDILDVIKKNDGNRHFCIFDELYSGTNPLEASKAAKAFLLYLSGYPNVHFILTTHYTNICRTLALKCSKDSERRQIKNMKMDVWEEQKGFVYTYRMVHGISRLQGAIRVLEAMDYPKEIIDVFLH